MWFNLAVKVFKRVIHTKGTKIVQEDYKRITNRMKLIFRSEIVFFPFLLWKIEDKLVEIARYLSEWWLLLIDDKDNRIKVLHIWSKLIQKDIEKSIVLHNIYSNCKCLTQSACFVCSKFLFCSFKFWLFIYKLSFNK